MSLISHGIGTSIDFETDTKIQEALRDEFVNSAVITVAHRLQTIMDYDRVVRNSIYTLAVYCETYVTATDRHGCWQSCRERLSFRTYC